MTRHGRRSLAAGVAIATVYVASAWLSGQLSPLARRPILDGYVPPVPYRWVSPPPELAATNVEPASGNFRLALLNRGSETKVFTTDDAQVTLILPRGAFAPAPDQRVVEISIQPLAPTRVTPPVEPLEILGNVYRVEAAYLPSNEPAELEPDVEARAVLVYPFVSDIHGGRQLIVSEEGEAWSAVDTNDLPSILQVDGPLLSTGYVAVAASTAATSPPPVGGGDSDTATIAIGAGLIVLALGAVYLAFWPVRRSRFGSAPRRRLRHRGFGAARSPRPRAPSKKRRARRRRKG